MTDILVSNSVYILLYYTVSLYCNVLKLTSIELIQVIFVKIIVHFHINS